MAKRKLAPKKPKKSKKPVKKKIQKKTPKRKPVKVFSKKVSVNKKVSKKTLKRKGKVSRLRKKDKGVKLKRVWHNPIISPRSYPWESKATFNPAAFEHDGKVYILYRAIGEDDTSVLGYAVSKDGRRIDERPTNFVYKRYMDDTNFALPVFYDSGGGWAGGCEDPRLSLIDDTVYMLYTAFDGWGSVRIALTSIALDDFKKKKWNKWAQPVLISPPGEIHKNWVLFPEKINGKYAILHSVSPGILIDYFKNLEELNGERFIKSIHQWSPEWNKREKGMRGVGPTPIKTKLGWLVLYHAMEESDPNRYKLFAMILDSKNPAKIIYRSKNPILEPDLHYENEGYKWGVIYSCGAVVKDGELLVYYGGADKVSCVASISLSELMEDLKKNKAVKLKKSKELAI